MTTLHLLFTMVAGFLCNLILTPIIIRIAHRNRWYDELNDRKIHVADTPRLGGIGIFISFLLATLVALFLAAGPMSQGSVAPQWAVRFLSLVVRYLPILVGMTIIHFLGLIDDFRNLRAVLKLLVQILAATVVVIGPFRIESFTVPFIWTQVSLGFWSYPITVIWIVAISNALNFIDGVDGLAGGTAALSALFFAIVAFLLGNGIAAAIAVALLGALLGFIVFNLPQARVFMGDSGSYVLGFVLGVLPLAIADGARTSMALIPAVTILMVPIVDMTTSVFRRLRRGKHPFSADREHMHHKLMDLGFGTWSILSVVYGATVVLGVAALLWYLATPQLALLVILGVWSVVIVLSAVLTKAQRRISDNP